MQWKIQFPDSSVGKESPCNSWDSGLIPGSGRPTVARISYPPQYSWASFVAQLVKNLPTVRETWVRSLVWEDPLEKGKATQSSILAWRISWTVESMGSQRVGHDWVTFTLTQSCLTLCDNHGLQHTRLPCATPRAYSKSCPSRWWYHPTISSSVIPFSCLQCFPSSGSFQIISSYQVATVLELRHLSFYEYSQLIFFRIDWFDLAVQGTLKTLLQHHRSKASILQHSAFFKVQLSHLYMTTGKTIALTRQTFASKVMSLLFNMLSRLVTAFLPKSKHLFMAAVAICSDFGAPKNKVSHCFHCFPIYFPWSDGTRCHDLSFCAI